MEVCLKDASQELFFFQKRCLPLKNGCYLFCCSEIGVACVDESLEVTVARNVAKTIQLFAVKSEQMVNLYFAT